MCDGGKDGPGLIERLCEQAWHSGPLQRIPPVVAVAALEEGVITPDFTVTCRGGATFYGRFFQCHLKGGHGSMDLRHAIE